MTSKLNPYEYFKSMYFSSTFLANGIYVMKYMVLQ